MIERVPAATAAGTLSCVVFIGIELDEPALTARLDACLLDDAELAAGSTAWTSFPDPWPVWFEDLAAV